MKKNDSLQALRGIAFLGIFFVHSQFVVEWAGISVSLFFVLSGFLCERKYGGTFDRTDVRQGFRFAWERLRKIYPLHILLMLAWAARKLLSDHSLRAISVKAAEVLLNVTLTQSWIPDTNVNVCLNGVAWFLSSITAHHFIFPAVDRLLQRKQPAREPILILLFMMLLQILSCWLLKTVSVPTEIYGWFNYTFPVFRFVDFYAGMCLGHLTCNMQDDRRITVGQSVLELGALLLAFLLYRLLELPRLGKLHAAIYNSSTVYILPAAIWIWLFFRKKGIITRLLSVKPLVFLGNLSPYLFLIHFPVTQFDGWLLRLTDNVFIITGVELTLSVLLAIVYIKAKPYAITAIKTIADKTREA